MSLGCPTLHRGFEIEPESMKWVSQHTNANMVETDFFETCSTSYANSTVLWIILWDTHMSNQNKQLYIVISQTGTLLSRILKQITGAEYNHASISLSRDLERMYSFGRRNPYNPFWGGFVIESPRTGTFKRFSETKVLVLSVSVTEEQHAELKEMLDVMWRRRRKYSYNYIGLCLAYFHVVWKQEGCYYCSEFVGELLRKSRVDGTEQLRSSIIQPMQFLRVPHTLLYCGKLREYVSSTCSEGICEDAANRTVHR